MISNILIWNEEIGFYKVNEGDGSNLLLEDEQYLKTKWHYEFNIQYPAIFSGKVHMSFDMMNGKPKKLKFHILGNETSFS